MWPLRNILSPEQEILKSDHNSKNNSFSLLDYRILFFSLLRILFIYWGRGAAGEGEGESQAHSELSAERDTGFNPQTPRSWLWFENKNQMLNQLYHQGAVRAMESSEIVASGCTLEGANKSHWPRTEVELVVSNSIRVILTHTFAVISTSIYWSSINGNS